MQIERIAKSKVSLVNKFPFFGSLIMRYPAVETERIPTMATDGKYLMYNKEFSESLTLDECTGVVAHEACHIAFMHHLRIGTRDPFLWNVACDYVINPIVLAAGLTLPKDHLYDERFLDMDAEHVYELLMDDIKTGKIKIIFTDGSSLGNGKDKIKAQGWGDVEEPKGKNGKPMSEAEKSAEESETKVRVLQAAQTAKSRGNLPSAFKGLIDGYLEPKVNWKERIRTFAGGNKPDDYSYRRPNRKHMILSSVYLPTVEYTGSGIIVIGVDSSGSVSDMEIAQFLGEIKSIHSELRPELLVVLWVDTEIHHIAQYFAHDEFDDKTRYACGGTVLRPAFDWVEKEGVIPDSFIYLTDLEIGNDMDDLTPDYPVLWVSTRGDKAPFGEVVKIKIN